MLRKEYDVAVVGAGPAGLFAAHELTKRFGKNISIALLDKGNNIQSRSCPSSTLKGSCADCEPCAVTDGVMGAGLKSDGKLHFHENVIELHRMGLVSAQETKQLLTYLEKLLETWGLNGRIYPLNPQVATRLTQEVAELGLPWCY